MQLTALNRYLVVPLALGMIMPAVAAPPPPSPIPGKVQAFTTPGTPEAEIARVVETICPFLPAGDLATQCTDIVVNTAAGPGDVGGALGGLAGMAAEEDTSVEGTLVDAKSGRASAVEARIGNVRGGALAGAPGSTFSLNGRTFTAKQLFGEGGAAGAGARGWSVFVDGNYSRSDKDATSKESGFGLDDYRVTAGIDRTRGKWVLGAALEYGSGNVDLDANGGNLDVSTWGLFAYASYFPSSAWYVDAIFSYNTSDIDQKRNILYTIAGTTSGTVRQTAISNTDSNTASGSLSVGYDLGSAETSYGPFARLEFARTNTDGFQERMSNPGAPGSGLATRIDSQENTSVPLSIGIQASRSIKTGWGRLYPQATAEYTHEFDNDNDPVSGTFVDDVFQVKFSLPTDEPDRDYFTLGLGASALIGDNATIRLMYQGLFGYRDLSTHGVQLGLRLDW